MTGSPSHAHLPNVAIFGTGTISRIVISLLKREGFRIEAIWGQTPEEAELISRDLGIPYFTSRMDDVLLKKDVDLIVILCPPALHSQIAVKALGIGKHVLVQSPTGLNQDETLRMVQAAQYYPNLCSFLCNGLRFLPAITKMKSAIQSGFVGSKVNLCNVRLSMGSIVGKSYSWLCDNIMGGGVLNVFGAHIIDLIHFLTDQQVTRVHGTVRTFTKTTKYINGIRQIKSDDFVAFQMELSEGTFASVTLNSQVCGFEQEIHICGDEGRMVVRNGDLYGHQTDSSDEDLLLLQDGNDIASLTELEDPLLPPIYLKGVSTMATRLAELFLSDGTGDRSPHNATKVESPTRSGHADGSKGSFATFNDAQHIQAVIEAIQASSRDRCWTKVTELTEEDVNVMLLSDNSMR